VAQGVFLTYKCWYKRIVAVPRQLFTVAHVAQVVGIASLFKQEAISTVAQSILRQFYVLCVRDPFVFFKNFFA
jgi:hypothetical protein|tara:strand:- start:375 stop:593 length:219 start_codon:yes stop_codon:yes gene_type:complete